MAAHPTRRPPRIAGRSGASVPSALEALLFGVPRPESASMGRVSDLSPAPSWSLKPVRVPGLPARITLDAESELKIGRSLDNGLVLDSEMFSQVSAHHARLTVDGENLVLSDLESLNGTFVNGERIASEVLRPGDIIQLGGGGPRFVVERSDDLSATRIQAVQPSDSTRSFGQSTVIRVKKALGLPPDADIGAIVKKTETRFRRITVSAVVVILGVAGALYYFQDRSHQEVQRLEELSTKLAGELAQTHETIAAHRKALDDHKSALQQQRADLQHSIQQSEADGRTSDAELAALKRRLERTDRDLKLLDPVNLEQVKLEGVRRVREAVVFIETKVFLRDSKSKKRLHVDAGSPGSRANLDDAGEVFASEKSGSGFVVSSDGMVITNAHVVEPDDYREPIHMRDGSVLAVAGSSVRLGGALAACSVRLGDRSGGVLGAAGCRSGGVLDAAG